MTQDAEGRFKMIGAQGESLAGPILKIGNTNSRLRFGLPRTIHRPLVRAGSEHHCALGVGHRLGEFRKLCRLLGIPLATVGPD